MFYTKEHQKKFEALEKRVQTLAELVDVHEASICALLKVSINKMKLDSGNSSVTVTIHAPHGLRKDGTPKKKPGRKREELL